MLTRITSLLLGLSLALWAAPGLADPGALQIRPLRPAVPAGGTVRLTVYSDLAAVGTRRRVRNPVWTSNGGRVGADGRFHAKAPGVYTVRALYSGRSASVTVRVVAVASLVHRVQMVPPVARIKVGEPLPVRALVYDRFGRRLELKVEWAMPEGVRRDAKGLLTGMVPGRYEIRAVVPSTQVKGLLRLTVEREPLAVR